MDFEPAPFTVTSRAQASTARRKIREFAAVVVDADAAYDVELMTAEGIANVIHHGSGDPVITVRCNEKALRVEVSDDGPGLQIARRTDHGRGLGIIDELAARWSLVTDESGTCLWFEVDREVSE